MGFVLKSPFTVAGLQQCAGKSAISVGIQFNVTFDSSWASAPAALQEGFTQALANFSANLFVPVTINLAVGHGFVGTTGQSVQAGASAQTISTQPSSTPTYAQLRDALINNAKTPEAINALTFAFPSSDPTGAFVWNITQAHCKALGLNALVSSTVLDINTGFQSGETWFVGTPNGGLDAVGTVMHEVSEGLGRQMAVAPTQPDIWWTLNRFRYASAGVVSTANGSTASYFSIDNGTTNLGNFNTHGGDPFDWDAGTVDSSTDCCNAFASSNAVEPFTATDYALMDMIGYSAAP